MASSKMTAGQSRRMFVKIQTTKAENAAAAVESAEFRRTDPLEIAKTTLRQAGYTVYSAAVERPLERGKFVVGRLVLTRGELMERAAQVAARRKAT